MPGVDDIDGVDLMPLETPVLKVSRPVAACSRCRTAKIKCDGKLPACTSCERNGRADECTSTNDQFARGKERSYVSTLETRIDKLQAKLEDVRRRKPSVISIPDDDLATVVPSRRPSHEPRAPSGPPTPTTSKAQRREEASAIDELVSGFGFLSVNATARDFYGFTSAMSYARLILSACTKDPLPQGTNKALPPHNITAQLVQHYFDNFFQLIPVFDKASFYASIDNVYRGQPGQAEAIDHWMLRMVLAIASATLSERSGDHHYFEGIGHVCAALEHAESVLHPGSITSVQALVLLVEYAMLDPHHFDSWSLIGAASRAMIDLGLHQDPPKGTAMSKHKLELRRRVFWCVYCFDRSTSLVQTRAFSFSDHSAKVKVPFARQPASQPQSPAPQEANARPWMDSHQHTLDLIALRRLQSTWYSDLFQSGRERWNDPEPYIWKACDEMKTWFENISASASPNMLAFFELDMLYSYVYVLSPSPRVPVITPFAQTLIFEYCIRFADLMLQRISQPRNSAPTTFYDAMRVYMTGRQFLDVLQSNTEGLLSGVIPPRPDVKAHGRPPPPLPPINIPPGDNAQHFNTARSINCIRQISDCLSRFGVRWGYMSWNQRYQTETSELLDELTGRLRELEVMAGTRRPSVWQTNSSGSIGSNNSGSAFGSPNNSVVGQPMYQSPPAIQGFGDASNAPNYVASGASRAYNTSPQYQLQDQNAYQRRGSTMQPNFARRPSAVPMSASQTFNYNAAPSMQPPVFNMNPQSQFGAWGGYGGPSRPDTLDEENAVPPNAAP